MAAPDLYRLPRAKGEPAAALSLGAVGAVVGVIGLAIWAATQYAAYRLGFHPALGVPLLVVPLPYRGLLASGAVLGGGLGAGCAAARWWRAEAAGPRGQAAGVSVGAGGGGRTLHYLRHSGPQHVLAFAPSRSGKGVGLVLPTLLSWPGSCVVNDIKGENWALTAGWRQRELGG